MLGSQVVSDLELDGLGPAVPTLLPWGATAFRTRLTDLSADSQVLKRRQLPFVAFKNNATLRDGVRSILSDLSGAIADIDTCFASIDPLASESIKQIFLKLSWN